MNLLIAADGKYPCWCNSCGRNTDHDVVHREVEKGADPDDGTWWETHFLLVRCRGCKARSLRQELEFSEWDHGVAEITHEPDRLWLRRPIWLDEIEGRDADMHGLLVEVYSAANDRQKRLLSMGVRAALDHLMLRVVGDVGGFAVKLEEMVKQGKLSASQKEMLEIVIDAGSASAHRGYSAPRPLLEQMVHVAEGLVRDYYIAGPMLATAKTLIPPRPPRPGKP